MATSAIIGARKRLRYPLPPLGLSAGRVAGDATAAALPPLAPHQEPPPDDAWRGWLLMAGRGAGKTYAGARWLLAQTARCAHVRIVAPTYGDARDVCVEGESGLLALARPLVAAWNRSIGELRMVNGCMVKLFSADRPDRLRGPQSGADWYDELAAWRYLDATLDMALMGLRLGAAPRWVATTTPRPLPAVRRLLADPAVRVTRARTYDNPHLPAAYLEMVTARYGGTRLGRQELDAEILEDTPGALWTLATIDASREAVAPPDLARVVVGIDPMVGDGSGDGETGIIVAARGTDGRGYVLADLTIRGTPAQWAGAVIAAAAMYGADAVVVEINQGGAMVAHTLRTSPGGARLRIREVRASRGKATRAEPISAIYEQGRVSHIGYLAALESQMTTWVPGQSSPDRMDALVWALADLFPDAAAGWSASDLAALSRPREV